MKKLGIEGLRPGRRCITTIPSETAHRPFDLVNREFSALHPKQLWVADITDVAIWSGFVSVTFVIDIFSRYIVGWRVLKQMQTDFILDTLEQALWARRKRKGVIHHSDIGYQYLSIRYTDRLAEAGFNASVGRVGDWCDNALAETINGLYKAEVIYKDDPWRGLEDVEQATLTWVQWFNNRRRLRPISDVLPAEFEMMYHQQAESSNVA